VIDDLTAALGEGHEETHVANRRDLTSARPTAWSPSWTTGPVCPLVIADRDGHRLLPSIVSFTPEGLVVGEAARRQLARRPTDTVYSVKRLMGRGWDDVKDELRYFPFKVLAGEGVVKLAVGGREVTPPRSPPSCCARSRSAPRRTSASRSRRPS
jgi:hypothetical protein